MFDDPNAQQPQGGFFNNLNDRVDLFTAGLGMAAGNSPNTLTNLSQGLLMGRQSRLDQLTQEAKRNAMAQTHELDKRRMGLQERGLDLQEQKLNQPGAGVNLQIKERPLGNGMFQKVEYNPQTGEYEPFGEPYKQRAGVEVNMNPDGTPKTGKQRLFTKQLDAAADKVVKAEDSWETALLNIQQGRAINAEGASRPGATSIDKLRRLASVLGVPVNEKEMSDVAILKAVQQEFASPRFADQKGAISDREFAAIQESIMNANNPYEANEMFMNFLETKERTKLERAQFKVAYMDANNTSSGFEAAWTAYAKDVPKMGNRESLFAVNPEAYDQWDTYLDREYVKQRTAEHRKQKSQQTKDEDVSGITIVEIN